MDYSILAQVFAGRRLSVCIESSLNQAVALRDQTPERSRFFGGKGQTNKVQCFIHRVRSVEWVAHSFEHRKTSTGDARAGRRARATSSLLIEQSRVVLLNHGIGKYCECHRRTRPTRNLVSNFKKNRK